MKKISIKWFALILMTAVTIHGDIKLPRFMSPGARKKIEEAVSTIRLSTRNNLGDITRNLGTPRRGVTPARQSDGSLIRVANTLSDTIYRNLNKISDALK